MTKRILLAGALGGLVMFVWGSLSHMVLGLGDSAIKQLPSEEVVMAAMRDHISESGFYFFPGYKDTPDMTQEQKAAEMQAWQAKFAAGPVGILIYHPEGRQALSPPQLLIELLSNIAAVTVGAFLLAWAAGGLATYGARVLFVALQGLIASLAIDVSYWNWYGFPGNYTVGALADQVVGFGAAGLVLAKMIKKREEKSVSR